MNPLKPSPRLVVLDLDAPALRLRGEHRRRTLNPECLKRARGNTKVLHLGQDQRAELADTGPLFLERRANLPYGDAECFERARGVGEHGEVEPIERSRKQLETGCNEFAMVVTFRWPGDVQLIERSEERPD